LACMAGRFQCHFGWN